MPWRPEELTYCSNIHPGASLDTVILNLNKWLHPVAQTRGLDSMAAGLWLAQPTAETLSTEQHALNTFKSELSNNALTLATLNGFPYGDFHLPVVKEGVYLPNWAGSSRYNFTLTLAKLFAALMPADQINGAISTLPLGYKAHWSTEQQHAACAQLCRLSEELAQLERDTGKCIQICLEMEPDCVLEHTHELIEFFHTSLVPFAQKQSLDPHLIYRHIGCCYDTCHQAVMHENIFDSLDAITHAGITIGKIQISNAIEADIHSADDLAHVCHRFKDTKFLHQVKIINTNGLYTELADLNEVNITKALEHEKNKDSLFGLWRIHFHIPIFLDSLKTETGENFISTTQNAIFQAIEWLSKNRNIQPVLEVETYSWQQFSQTKDYTLKEGIAAELSWLENTLDKYQLLTR